MIRSIAIALAMLSAACATHRDTPAVYDFDSVQSLPDAPPRLAATIAIPQVSAPSWLRTPALIYRLDYDAPARPRAYARSAWAAPPAELLTLRLRELVTAANSAFTVARRGSRSEGFRLDVTLERFEQTFASPSESRCIVQLTATLIAPDDRTIAQRSFRAQRAAPSADAAGAVRGLVEASDDALEQILNWLGDTLQRNRPRGTR